MTDWGAASNIHSNKGLNRGEINVFVRRLIHFQCSDEKKEAQGFLNFQRSAKGEKCANLPDSQMSDILLKEP